MHSLRIRINEPTIKQTNERTLAGIKMLREENIFSKNMISRGPVYMIYTKTDSTVKNREYAFAKTFESVFDEDTFFNSCLLLASAAGKKEDFDK